MRFYVGTSGFAYKAWKGPFYPEDLPDAHMLRHYAGRLPAVEINNTFYRMPRESVVLGWADDVPATFRFVLKASQKITHFGRLKNVASELEYFLRVSQALGARRGPTLFQLPPNLKKDLPRLTDFLALLPEGWPAAFEFRQATWFADDVYDALRAKNAALCIADTGEEGDAPFVVTADWGYLRLRREHYGDADLDAWARKVTGAAWSDGYVFFKHEDAGAGPRL
ncbi:MAG TPA: DUF72 domain-containing protein, partial [Gemmatimonadales bacterium]|nr:DUF72 domain-containing protein [Gemmatimonadales bacterium]